MFKVFNAVTCVSGLNLSKIAWVTLYLVDGFISYKFALYFSKLVPMLEPNVFLPGAKSLKS